MAEKEFFRPAEVAERLGVSRQTVYAWVKGGALDAIRPGAGHLIRIPRAALNGFVKPSDQHEGLR